MQAQFYDHANPQKGVVLTHDDREEERGAFLVEGRLRVRASN